VNKEKVKQEILDLGSDNIPTFGGLFEGGIHLQQNIDEITDVIDFLYHKQIKNFLEIGSASGGNTFILNKYLNFNRIVIIDDNQHTKHKLRPEILKNVNYEEFIGDSQSKESNNFIRNLNIKFDLIFIDADHTYNGVKKDTFNFKEFLNNSKYIAFHDTVCLDGVKKWIDELKNGVIELSYITTFSSKNDPKGISIFKK